MVNCEIVTDGKSKLVEHYSSRSKYIVSLIMLLYISKEGCVQGRFKADV